MATERQPTDRHRQGEGAIAPAGDERRPLSRMRRAVAAAMTAGTAIPQFAIERGADLEAVDRLRAELAAAGRRVSYQDVVTAAAAAALRAHPEINSSFDDDAIVIHPDVNVGIAMALPDGLVSPAIRAADRLRLDEIAAERVRLREGAKRGKLAAEELFGATFGISNLGPLGVERFTALVIPGQAAILALGAVSGPGPRINLTLSCDHRVVDGAPAAEFLATLVAALEEPDELPR